MPAASSPPVSSSRQAVSVAATSGGALRAKPASRRWEAAVFWPLLAAVLLAPLPLGSNRPLPASVLAAAVGVLLCVWGVGRLLGRLGEGSSVRPFGPGILLVGLAATWAALQAAPFTPRAWHHPYWADAAAVLDMPLAGAISLNPHATWNRLMGLLAYGGIFWLALHLCRSSRRAHQALFALAAGGLLYAAYGLFDYLEAGVVTSTFVNRNSYATYAGMTLFCGLGLARGDLAPRMRGMMAPRRIAAMLAYLETPFVLGVVTCLVAGTALLLTQSRGALVALCAALVAFVWALRRTAVLSSASSVRAAAALAAGLIFGLLLLAGGETVGRFREADAHAVNRLAYYRATWQAIAERPLLGTGYGTYADAFRSFNRPETGTYFLDRAHNTYLQVIMELGWPAAIGLYAGLALLVWRGTQSRRSPRPGAPYSAVLAACAALVAVHSLLDFSMEMPANAATFALLLGLGCAQAIPDRGVPAHFRQGSSCLS